ncbi:MAG: lasso peptide biosynthesis B2 protein [Candidatus Binatia bacterium]
MEFNSAKASASNSQSGVGDIITVTERSWPKTAKETCILVWVLGVVVSIRLLLRALALTTLLRWLSPSRHCVRINADMLDKIARYTDGVLWWLSVSAKGNCLPRSLALFYFATRCGFPVRLCCGVRRMGNTLEGHAWLTLLKRPFLERGNPESYYTITFLFPSN